MLKKTKSGEESEEARDGKGDEANKEEMIVDGTGDEDTKEELAVGTDHVAKKEKMVEVVTGDDANTEEVVMGGTGDLTMKEDMSMDGMADEAPGEVEMESGGGTEVIGMVKEEESVVRAEADADKAVVREQEGTVKEQPNVERDEKELPEVKREGKGTTHK